MASRLPAPDLSPAQERALRHVRAASERHLQESAARLGAVIRRAGLSTNPDDVIAAMLDQSAAFNFHPDRIAADGRLVAEALAADGVYRSQFETRISNGGLTAFPGGDRDRWEESLFGGAYQAGPALPTERPRYGGLNVMGYVDGPCPRFGSCHFRLRPHVLGRATFCFGDSHTGPTDIGTSDAFAAVAAAVLEAAEASGEVLGRKVTVQELVGELEGGALLSGGTHGCALDHYVETQIHGTVNLADDVEAIVVDPSFRGTAVGDVLEQLAATHQLDLRWHRGFHLEPDEVPSEFRGPAIPVLAHRVAEEFGEGSTVLHAERLGAAARSVVTNPERWADWVSPAETLQHIKQLWHVLVRFGRQS